MTLVQNGYLTGVELDPRQTPSEERYQKGPVACIECVQEIPCNPCEAACRQGAILIGDPIINVPVLLEEKCSGCGLCVAQCPGLAIFVVDKTYSDQEAAVSFPYEYTPLPAQGDEVEAVSRSGEVICKAHVVKVLNPKSFDRTPVITLAIPKQFANEVRSMKRLQGSSNQEKRKGGFISSCEEDDMIVCRCEEVTLGEIRLAIAQGAVDVVGVKRRTRAGMGLCQGRTCEKMIQQILSQELGVSLDQTGCSSVRPPVRPVTFGTLARGEYDETV